MHQNFILTGSEGVYLNYNYSHIIYRAAYDAANLSMLPFIPLYLCHGKLYTYSEIPLKDGMMVTFVGQTSGKSTS